MSLLVWLPLNTEGDFLNKGLANVTVTNNGATYNANGKIGGCYSFDGYWRNIYTSDINIGESFSICCWTKPINYSWTPPMYLYNSEEPISFCMHASNPGLCTFSMDGHDVYAFSNLLDGNWHHLCATFDYPTKTVKMYLNGLLKSTKTITTIHDNTRTYKLYLGSRNNGTWFNGSDNDVRIYDHCLSPAEVKEISKGLVLHYPLNELPINANLYTANDRLSPCNYNSGTYSSVDVTIDGISYNAMKRGSSGGGDIRLWWSTREGYPLTVDNKTITISLDVYSDIANIMTIALARYSDKDMNYSGNISIPALKWTRISYTKTYSANSDGSLTNTVECYFSLSLNSTVAIRNVKLEYGSTATQYTSDGLAQPIHDVSGYCNNGTVNGTLSLSSDTPRYGKCIKCNGATDIVSPSPFGARTMDEVTITFWHNPSALSSAYKTICSNSNPHSGFWISTNCESWALWFYGGGWYVRSNKFDDNSSISMSNGTWHQISLVYKNNTYKWYCDGKPCITDTYGTFKAPIFSSNISVGGNSNSNTSGSSSDFRQYGSISDFRIYSTALSADDILELYNTGAKVTDNGTLMAYEFNEE